MIVVGVFTCYIYYNQKDNIELYFNSINNSDNNVITERILDNNNDIQPTTENPFMNINLITDNKEKPSAPPSAAISTPPPLIPISYSNDK